MIVPFFPFTWTDSAVQVPTVPGMEWTLPENRLHFTLPENRLEYTLPENRLHFTLREEDG